jgi:hypothetical protein
LNLRNGYDPDPNRNGGNAGTVGALFGFAGGVRRMVTNREIENLLSGHWKSLTRSQQIDMAQELMTYRKARAEYEPGWGDNPAQQILGQFKGATDGHG